MWKLPKIKRTEVNSTGKLQVSVFKQLYENHLSSKWQSGATIALMLDFTAKTLGSLSTDGGTNMELISYRDWQNLGKGGGSKWPLKLCYVFIFSLSLSMPGQNMFNFFLSYHCKTSQQSFCHWECFSLVTYLSLFPSWNIGATNREAWKTQEVWHI